MQDIHIRYEFLRRQSDTYVTKNRWIDTTFPLLALIGFDCPRLLHLSKEIFNLSIDKKSLFLHKWHKSTIQRQCELITVVLMLPNEWES